MTFKFGRNESAPTSEANWKELKATHNVKGFGHLAVWKISKGHFHAWIGEYYAFIVL